MDVVQVAYWIQTALVMEVHVPSQNVQEAIVSQVTKTKTPSAELQLKPAMWINIALATVLAAQLTSSSNLQ